MTKNKCKKIISMVLLVCIIITGSSICAYAGGAFSSMNIEKSLLNNPVDTEWVRQAKQIKDDFYTSPYRYFESSELKYLIKKVEDAMDSYNSTSDYSLNTLIEIRNAFDNACIVRMRDY